MTLPAKSGAAIRLGVIGCGYWGPNLIRNFARLDGYEMAMVADLDPARRAQMMRLYPGIRAVTRGEELIRHPDIDAVAITTPVSTHFALARAALRAGKHVLVSKPMTRTSAEARELIALAEAGDLTLMVDHTFVYSSPVRRIKEMLAAGDIGSVYYFDSVRVNLGLLQSDVNVVWDLGPHDLSIMDYLLEEKPVAVRAVAADPIRYHEDGHESVAYVSIDLADGTLAHFHLSWLSPVKVRRTLISGSRKMLLYDHLDPDHQIKIYDKGVEIVAPDRKYAALVEYRTGDMYAPKLSQVEALETECQHFLRCCEGTERPLTDGWSGLRVVRLLEAAQQSIAKKGAVVPVDEVGLE